MAKSEHVISTRCGQRMPKITDHCLLLSGLAPDSLSGVGHHTLEELILPFKLLQSSGLVALQTAILLTSAVVGDIRNPGLLARLMDRFAFTHQHDLTDFFCAGLNVLFFNLDEGVNYDRSELLTLVSEIHPC